MLLLQKKTDHIAINCKKKFSDTSREDGGSEVMTWKQRKSAKVHATREKGVEWKNLNGKPA